MSHVDSKKCQCGMSLSLIFPMSHFEFNKKPMSHVTTAFSPCRMSLGAREVRVCACDMINIQMSHMPLDQISTS